MVNKKKFSKSFLYFSLFILLFPIIYLYANFSLISKIYNMGGVAVFLFFLAFYLKNKKIDTYLIFVSLFFLILGLVTYINNGELLVTIFYSARALALCYFFDYGIKNDKYLFINSTKFSLFIIVFINLIYLLILPNGIYRDDYGATYWLLGNKNNFLLYLFPLLFLVFSSKKICFFDCFCIIISLITTILSGSTTSIVFIVLILFYLFFKKMFSNYKIFNIKNYMIIFLLMFFLVVIFQNLKSFQFLIVDILGKDLTMTNRTEVWNLFLYYIKLKPVFGYGVESNLLKFEKFGVYHAHNEILEILYETGIVGFITFLIITIVPLKKLYKNRTNKIYQCQSFLIFCYLITMITEFRNYYYFVFIFVIMYNTEKLLKGDD